MKIILAIIIWFIFGTIGAGFDNAYFQRNFNLCKGSEDHGKSMITILFGPLNLLAYPLSGYGKYGWSLAINADPRCEGGK